MKKMFSLFLLWGVSKQLILSLMLCFIFIGSAFAKLHDRGGGLIYDDVLNITWLKDANYAKTSGFDADGLLSWNEANMWAANLVYYDSVRGVFYADWRLPSVKPINGTTFNNEFRMDGKSDEGYNILSPNSEFSYMYYVNLGLNGWWTVDGKHPKEFGVMQSWTAVWKGQVDMGLIKNLQSNGYWTGSADAPFPDNQPWVFTSAEGNQRDGLARPNARYAWAVRDGDVEKNNKSRSLKEKVILGYKETFASSDNQSKTMTPDDLPGVYSLTLAGKKCELALNQFIKAEPYYRMLEAKETVVKIPGLIAFWTFGEGATQNRASIFANQKLPLNEVGGPIPRVEGGPFSGYSATLDGRHYFRILREKIGPLDISGKDAQVSMFAVVRLDTIGKYGGTIAGIWSEGKGANDDTGTRQYSMLLNMPTYGGARQLTPHISSEGGVSRRADGSGLPWCADFAAPNSEIPSGKWVTLGFTYDGKYIRAYFNGIMEERKMDPVKDHREDSYFTKEGPNGGYRGMNPYYHGRGIFKYDPKLHSTSKLPPSDFTVGARNAGGSMLGEAMKGLIGGLAVFDRALTDEEMKQLHDAAHLEYLK
jgi:hypothetical protein